MTFIAAVRSADGAVTPTGAVQFFDGGTLLATVPLDRAKGDIAASFTTDGLPLGTHLMLGKMRGRIVRYVESGIAIEFLKPLNTTQLSAQFR